MTLRHLGPLLLILLLCGFALLYPDLFTPLKVGIVPGLGLIMFGMGLTLDRQQIEKVLRNPRWLLIGVFLQFAIMPFVAWLLARLAGLSPELTVGMVLTGASPGGTASNVMVYLSGGNLALSVAMTTFSTLLAPVATPLFTLWYAGKEIEVPTWEMLASVVQIIILPLVGGMLCGRYLNNISQTVIRYLPWLSLTIVALIVATIVALNHQNLATTGPLVGLLVILHNSIGLLFGYWGARLSGAEETECRTIALEVGMQNSGLATALAVKFFPAITSLPAALFSIWHNLSALMLSVWWKGRDSKH